MPMGQNTDDVDRGDRVVRAQRVRQPRLARSRRPTWPACVPHRRPQDTVDDAGARGVAAALVVADRWKATASHNAATAGNALEHPAVDVRRSRSSPACGSRSSCRSRRADGDPVRVGNRRAENVSAVPGAPTRTAIGGRSRSGGAPDVAAKPPAPGYPREVSGPDLRRWHELGSAGREGPRHWKHTHHTTAGVRARFVRITQTASIQDAPPWSIQRLQLYEAANRTRYAMRGARKSCSAVIS